MVGACHPRAEVSCEGETKSRLEGIATKRDRCMLSVLM